MQIQKTVFLTKGEKRGKNKASYKTLENKTNFATLRNGNGAKLRVFCDGCGYIYLFAAEVQQNWKDKQMSKVTFDYSKQHLLSVRMK